MADTEQIPWKILIVDDDAEDYRITADLLAEGCFSMQERLPSTGLTRAACGVEWASGYDEAMDRLFGDSNGEPGCSSYDAVLVDFELGLGPGSPHSGLGIIREAQARGCRSPFILLTGQGSSDVDFEAMRAGAMLYLTKSEVTPNLLERAVRYSIEQKQKELALQASEEMFSKVFYASPDALVVSQQQGGEPGEGRILEVNAGFEKIFGYTRAEAVGSSAAELGLFDAAEALCVSAETVETRARAKNGEQRCVTFSVEPFELEGRPCSLTTIRDITLQKQAEDALKDSERRYRQLAEDLEVERGKVRAVIDHLPVGVAVCDGEGNVLSINETGLRMHGFASEGEMLSRLSQYAEDFSLVTLDEQELPVEAWPATLAISNQPVRDFIVRLRDRRSGSERIVSYSAAPVFNAGGERMLIVYMLQDLTGRYESEQELVVRSRALQESETRFRQLADAMPQLVWTARPDGTVDYYNRRYLEYHGISAVDPAHWQWTPVLHDDDFAPTMAAWESALRGGETYQVEHRVRMADGSYRWHLSRGIPARDAEGAIIRWYGTATDIHETKVALAQAEESHRLLEALMEFVPEGIAITGGPPDYRIRKVSRYGFALTGSQSMEELLHPAGYHQQAWGLLMPDGETLPGPEEMPLFRASHYGEEIIGHELALRVKTGKIIPVLVNAAPIRDGEGKIVAAINVWRDITDRKASEETLTRYAAQLARSNEDLANFAYIASHDLQEPLRKIIRFGDILKRRLGEVIDPDNQDVLNRMIDASARMGEMITKLLELSRVSTHGEQFQPVDLSEVVAGVLDDLEARITTTGGRVEAGRLPVIEADPVQMHQLFQNLIGNALKFHKPGEAPLVRVSAAVEDGWGRIRVEDFGIGFDAAYAAEIFQPFRRLHGRSEYEGTGMGLAICQRIVERHKGVIEAQSEKGVGTVFTITLPARQA